MITSHYVVIHETMNEIKLFLDLFKWFMVVILIGVLVIEYINFLEARDIRHVKLCEKIECLGPRIGGPPGGGK